MGPKKKRKSKKQLKEEELLAERLKREEAEEKRREEEARQLELERQRVEAKLKEKRERMEEEVRDDVLKKICEMVDVVRSDNLYRKIARRELEEWERYLKCDRLPFPQSPSVMHTHLYLWENCETDRVTMDEALSRAETIVDLLRVLDELILDPLDANARMIENWREVRELYRKEQMHKIDRACFFLIREIESTFNRIDFWAVDYKRVTENITLTMWGWLEEPVSQLDKRSPPNIDFSECGIRVKLPVPYNKNFVILRVIRTLFNHFSDTSATWDEPKPDLEHNLYSAASRWYSLRERFKEEQSRLEEELKQQEEANKLETDSVSATEAGESTTAASDDDTIEELSLVKELIKTPSPEPLNDIILPFRSFMNHLLMEEQVEEDHNEHHESNNLENNDDDSDTLLELLCPRPIHEFPGIQSLFELVKNTKLKNSSDAVSKDHPGSQSDISKHIKDLTTLLQERDLSEWNNHLRSLEVKVAENELNLRRFSVLGGVYFIDLIKHVPQAFKLKNGFTIQLQYGEYNIDKEHFHFVYVPPKATETTEDEDEKPPVDDSIDRLVFVEVTLPQHVLWFEAPSVVLWDKTNKFWSNEHVYDIKFNEEKQMISCRIGRLDPLGLAAIRFNNLPFQTWELRPDWDDPSAVVLSLTASTVILEFLIKGSQVALQSLQNATGTALESIQGQLFYPNELIERMKYAGVDVFPCVDTFLYIEGHSAKWPHIENHVYISMATFANVYQFTWSRWNLPAGRNALVFQMREALSKQTLSSYSMVMSNLYRTVIVNCSEVSPSFTETSVPDLGFYPDLYSLLSNVTSEDAMKKVDTLDIDLILTICEMLSRTKVFSYS